MGDKKDLAVYIHVPFCRSKCKYCDFVSFPTKTGCSKALFDAYFSALELEVRTFVENGLDYELKTVFIGGGTPTLVPPEYIYRVLGILFSEFGVSVNKSDGIEITTEANPDTVDYDKLCGFRQAGINRLSLGVQSFSDKLLTRISRVHNAETALAAFDAAKRAGFQNLNIDLMFALPEQTVDDLKETLDTALELNPQHISFYGLILEENSALYEDKTFTVTDDDTDRDMYELVVSTLKQAGYRHYEISNFAVTGFECRHNTVYWTGGDYIGFGLAAHSLINGERFRNTDDLDVYLQGAHERLDVTLLSERDKYAEFFFLGLRLLDGVEEGEFFRRFGVTVDSVYADELNKLTSSGLLLRNNGVIRLSRRGIDLSNIVFEKFI